MPRWVLGLLQFLPLSAFATYAYWNGPPDGHERWLGAFMIGAAAAGLQLAVALPRPEPTNRLVLGTNLYLLVGGAAAFTRQWRVLHLYGVLRESAIFVVMLLVGAATTLWSPAGYVGATHRDRRRVRVYSVYLLAVTAGGLATSLAFQGHGRWVVVVPLIALALANRYLVRRLDRAPGA